MKDVNVYGSICDQDVIGLLQELFESYGYKLRDVDGKIHATLTTAVETPWVHIKPAYRSNGHNFDCYIWHKIQFNAISMKLKEPFVPSECQKCWKLVVRPHTIVELFELENLERQLNRPSKCGIEVRNTVPALYGGYFYNESKEEGLNCYDIVYEAMSHNEILKPLLDIVDEEGRTKNLLLKRGCTEFEHLCGDSKNWKVTPEQLRLEALMTRYVVTDDVDRKQPDILINHVHRRWIEFAYQNADPTYKYLTGGNPLFPDYRTYHQEEKRNGKERKNDSKDNDRDSSSTDNRGDHKKSSKSNKAGTKSRNAGGVKRDKAGKFAKTKGKTKGKK